MKKLILIFLVMSVLTGCAHYELKQRLKKVVYFNGINEHEAKVIAEMKLVHSAFAPYYETTEAQIRDDKDTQKYPQYWFVDFTQPLLFDAPSFLVVIDKESGDIALATEYYPKRVPGLDFITGRIKSLR